MRNHTQSAFAPVDLLAIAVLAVLALSIGLPAAQRARELSKRGVCALNLRALGASARGYAENHGGTWMVPPFDAQYAALNGIDYRNDRATDDSFNSGAVGIDRDQSSGPESFSVAQFALSTTRSFWLLVRSGAAHPAQFVCPSSGDVVDPTESFNLYYDFTQYPNVSYGYRVPFGPAETRPRLDADPRQVFAADKGPFYARTAETVSPNWTPLHENEPLMIDSDPFDWRRYNSPNHGGARYGEGQNVLRADGSVEFARTPLAGIDGDNIYTLIDDDWANAPRNFIHGSTPQGVEPPPYPGEHSLGQGKFSSTDSLIYP